MPFKLAASFSYSKRQACWLLSCGGDRHAYGARLSVLNLNDLLVDLTESSIKRWYERAL